MVPAFVNMKKDNDGFIHLYFFPGVDDNENPIDYKFDNKSICKIHCKLVPTGNGEVKFKTLELKNE